MSSARAEGDQLTNDARLAAHRAREGATALRKRHDEDIARLQQMATEHRERLRTHFTQMLGRVDSATR